MKPNLFIVGAPKCGTTAWVEYLRTHPMIHFSKIKEPHYFSSDLPQWRHVRTESDYLRLFQNFGDAKIIGEASVWYLRSEVAAAEIKKFNPLSKIIILVRSQDQYLASLHNQMVYNGDETIMDVELAWKLSQNRDIYTISATCREPKLLDYKACGRFSEQVERYFAEFPEEQIRVFHFRDWSRNPRQTYLEILRFLGVEDDGRTEFPRINAPRLRRTSWLGPLVRNPPRALRVSASLLKRIIGRRSLGIAKYARALDTRQGSVTTMTDSLSEEIRAYFIVDNALLEPRIWIPRVTSRD